MQAWLARHGHALVSSTGHLARAPLATALTVIVMALALAMPLGLATLVGNLRQATGDFSGAIGVSVYLKESISEAQARQLLTRARARHGVATVRLTTASEALEEFRQQSGFGAALDALQGNPLPHVLSITTAGDESSPAEVEQLRAWLANWPEVDAVQVDRDWVVRFNALLALLRRVLAVAAVLLGAGVIAVVGNTIRLEIQNRRAEIEVTKLVGGTNRFVRRPFLYTGLLYGAAAGVLSWLFVLGAIWALGGTVADLASAYGAHFGLMPPGARELGLLVAGGVACGWLGAWIATARHLARIEPRA